jgi:hypothetical protein
MVCEVDGMVSEVDGMVCEVDGIPSGVGRVGREGLAGAVG